MAAPPIEPPPWPFSREIRRLICDLHDGGAEQAAIARYLGATPARVRSVLKRNGKLRGQSRIYLYR